MKIDVVEAAEWEEVKKTKSEELGALADTFIVLHDDAALELLKKTCDALTFKSSTVSLYL